MHPKTQFRFLLKLVGVYFVILGLLDLVTELAGLFADFDTVVGGEYLVYFVRNWTYLVVELAAGLYVFFGANWIVNAAFASPHPCCPHCGYSLQTDQARCPECGAEISSTSQDDKLGDISPDATSHKLTVVSNTPMLEVLMRRLEEAKIDAFSATERAAGELFSGGELSVGVWVKSAQDLERASEILRELQAQRTCIRCPNCQCDLRGHTARSTCPECGHDLPAPLPDVECPDCGKAGPAGFERCWNCEESLPDPIQKPSAT